MTPTEVEDLRVKRVVAFACVGAVVMGAVGAIDILDKLGKGQMKL